jgi:hypothetical protein
VEIAAGRRLFVAPRATPPRADSATDSRSQCSSAQGAWIAAQSGSLNGSSEEQQHQRTDGRPGREARYRIGVASGQLRTGTNASPVSRDTLAGPLQSRIRSFEGRFRYAHDRRLVLPTIELRGPLGRAGHKGATFDNLVMDWRAPYGTRQ